MFRISVLCGLVTIAMAFGPARAQTSSSSRPMSVLFISVDDLRPAGASYGAPEFHTPYIDGLAERGAVFTRAYVQQAVCSPSRTSVLTGRRPETTGIRDLATHFRVNLPEVVTLPQHFKQHGYHTQSVGKIYHAQLDDPQSWSVPAWFPAGDPGAFGEEYAWGNPETISRMQAERDSLLAAGHRVGLRVIELDPATGTPLRLAYDQRFKGPSWEAADVADEALPDGKVAGKAVEILRQNRDRPFFLAVGFYRPHLPFVAPRRDFDLYPLDAIRLPEHREPPRGVPAPALPDWGELRSYSDIASGPLPDQQALELIRAYRASTTFVDRQIGKVLEELDRLGLRDRTIIVLWSDHGYHLGEHGHWTKHTNFEIATRAPLIFYIPGRPPMRSDALVEFVDVYPTLVQQAGLSMPSGLEGTSLVPLFDDPGRTWKLAAFSEYPRGAWLGRSMRTDRYRYTEWRRGEDVLRELYDHHTDARESVNLAGSGAHDEIVMQLSGDLRRGWRGALPTSSTDH